MQPSAASIPTLTSTERFGEKKILELLRHAVRSADLMAAMRLQPMHLLSSSRGVSDASLAPGLLFGLIFPAATERLINGDEGRRGPGLAQRQLSLNAKLCA